MTKNAPLIIDSHDTLARFRASLWKVWLPSAPRIDLDRHFAGEDTGRLEERLNDVYFDCGCDAAAAALGLTAVGLVGWLLVAAVGGGMIGPQSQRLKRVVAEAGPGHPDVRRISQRLERLTRLELTLFVLLIADMVFKPGT